MLPSGRWAPGWSLHRYVLPPAGYNQYVNRILRTIPALALLVLLCTGCNNGLVGGSATSGLQKTAAEYYNFRVGNLQGREYSSFLSPAYRNSFSKEGLEVLNKGNAAARASNSRIEKVTADDVAVSTEASFAMTDVPASLGFAFQSMEPQRWVRTGGRWYLYLGSDREVSEYGYFPVSIPYPVVPEEQPAQVLDEKRRKDVPQLPETDPDGEGGA